MEEKGNLFESLLEKALDYGKASYDLARLRTLDRIADVGSSLIPHTIVFVLLASFMLFFNIGLAFWLGEILGRLFLGFAVVAAFYGLLALIMHFFLHKSIKRRISNFIIKQALK